MSEVASNADQEKPTQGITKEATGIINGVNMTDIGIVVNAAIDTLRILDSIRFMDRKGLILRENESN
jgi:hypothetical protein